MLAKIKFRESLTVHTVLDRCRHLSDLHGERNTDALMGWICFILLIVWAVWTICTNIGKIVTFLTLVVCGIMAVCFGFLVFERVAIGLARAITFTQDHGWMVLSGVVGVVAAVFVMLRLRDVPVVHYTASNQHDDQ